MGWYWVFFMLVLVFLIRNVELVVGLSSSSSSSSSSSAAAAALPVIVSGSLVINGSLGIAETDANFICATLDWWPSDKCDYGWCSWGHANLFNLDLDNIFLINAVRAFSPLKLRLGGTLQDKVIYEMGVNGPPCNLTFIKNPSIMFGFTEACLPMSRWDQLNHFFARTRAMVIFGLNALNGRVRFQDGSLGGPWNYSNAAALIRYTVDQGYYIHGWELGNELSGSGVGTSIKADQYAADVKALHNIVYDVYKDYRTKPLVLAPGGFFEANWFQEFIDNTEPSFCDVVTHHIYNLGPGVDDHLVQKILDASYLDGEANVFRNLKNILENTRTSAKAWVGEAGGAYNSGRNNVSNAFVFSFWYLDQLGMSAKFNTKTYCRQTLIGGNYGLLNTTTFRPNPDYYSALLWHRLMGRVVLAANFSGPSFLRTYAHCSKYYSGVTVLLINLSNNTTVETVVTAQPAILHTHKHRGRKGRVSESHRLTDGIREEYHLTPKDGDLHSRIMLLNGEELHVSSEGSIPLLRPRTIDQVSPIVVAPFSIVFARFLHLDLPACL